MPRIESLAKAGYYPTPPQALEMLRSKIAAKPPRRRGGDLIRILDPCCGTGEALLSLAHTLNGKRSIRRNLPVETYGIEVQAQRAEQARQNLDHLLEADFFRTSIGNNQFSLLLLNPPYDTEAYSPDGRRRTELAYLQRCTPYLAAAGLLIFIIPQNVLGKVNQYLSGYYRQIQCLPFPEEERERFNQVVVLAEKKPSPFPDAASERMISQWADVPPKDLCQQNAQQQQIYYAEPVYAGSVLFINLELDIAAAVDEARERGILANQTVKHAFWPGNTETVRPLMPLRKGHLAQLIAAGFTDNVELQHGNHTILVKGRITKTWEETLDTPSRTVQSEKLTASVVALNLHTGKIERIKT